MRKLPGLFIAVGFSIGLVACGNDEQQPREVSPDPQNTMSPEADVDRMERPAAGEESSATPSEGEGYSDALPGTEKIPRDMIERD